MLRKRLTVCESVMRLLLVRQNLIKLGDVKMGKALIIGAGGVASVAIHKCVQNSEVFEEICIASRTKSKCDDVKGKT